MLPYSPEIYLQLFAPYNLKVWPLQPLFAVGFIAALVLSVRQKNIGGRLFSTLLAVSYIILGWVFYFRILFDLLWISPVLTVFCLFQSILLLWSGTIRNVLIIEIDDNIANIAGLLMIILATAYYPMISLISSEGLTLSQYAGFAPLPTLVLTLGFYLTSIKTLPGILIIIPAILLTFEGLHNYLLNESGGLALTAAAVLGLVFLIVCFTIRKTTRKVPG